MESAGSNPAITCRGPHRAFTLVEFLVAVLFLATVFALAVPRLGNLGTEARSAKQQAIFGSVRAAAQITRAAAQIHNQTGTTGLVTVDGLKVSTVFGYPAASMAGIIAATGLDTANDRVTIVGGGGNAGNAITIALNGARGSCAVVYIAPTAPDALPTVNSVNADGSGGAGC
jgi:MSHA pilin protein MshA